MSWVKVDDHMSEHPKIVQAGPLAAWLHVCALQYASRNLTDGFIPSRTVATLANFEGISITTGGVPGICETGDDVRCTALVETLVAVGLWEPVQGGYQIHDYLEYQPAKAEVLDQRRQNADRQAAWKERQRSRNGRTNDVANAPTNVTSNGRSNDATNGVSNGVANSTPYPVPVPVPVTYPVPVPDPAPDTRGVQGGAAASAAVCVPEPTPSAEDDAPSDGAPPDPVLWVWEFYRSEIQPEAKLCPRPQIVARLKRFEVDELTVGIQNFRDDPWCMAHNRTRGGKWFFHSDDRSEQFLNLEPRLEPVAIANGRRHG